MIRRPDRSISLVIPLIVLLSVAIFYGTYWWYTNFHCTSHTVELVCRKSGTNTRCREVQVCDGWAPNEAPPPPVPRHKRKMKAEAE
jgi:hypothetical protein